jgi:hypothetical protein
MMVINSGLFCTIIRSFCDDDTTHSVALWAYAARKNPNHPKNWRKSRRMYQVILLPSIGCIYEIYYILRIIIIILRTYLLLHIAT